MSVSNLLIEALSSTGGTKLLSSRIFLEKSFDCPGGGKYIVADGAVKTDYDHECLGDVVLDESVTK